MASAASGYMVFKSLFLYIIIGTVTTTTKVQQHQQVQEQDVMVNNAVEENTIPDGGSLAWSGYAMIVLSVLALWSGFVSEPVAVFLAFVLLLLGCGFLHVAMLAPSKPKML